MMEVNTINKQANNCIYLQNFRYHKQQIHFIYDYLNGTYNRSKSLNFFVVQDKFIRSQLRQLDTILNHPNE
ncbi:hypothetical protein [Virgibacillus proomii]|uniref:hypothetical protein n=1 Tax=Virgibacillus proomii TaxID=84407 RepID=UPI001C117F30|nr:hypothetical protein [Virgibacillus proomii]MBU5267140.1 hypothetical protein [Virgibacillus proomii]